VRREGLFRWGLIVAAAAIICFVVGAIVTNASDALEVASAEGRAELSNAITFDAEDETYALTLIDTGPLQGDALDPIAHMTCTVDNADGSHIDLDPATSNVRVESSIGTSIASFDGVPGRTTVRCDVDSTFGSTVGYVYSVAQARTASRFVGLGILGLGVVAAIAAALLIGFGLRGRVVITDVPVEAPAVT
jgi:hypothetical protein